MKIAYVSILPSDDVQSWSGLNLHIAQSLENQGLDILRIRPLANPARSLFYKVKARLLTKLSRARYLWTKDPGLLKYYASEAAKSLSEREYDLIFSPGTEPIAYLSSGIRKPIVTWTDATFGAMVGYYPWYQHLSARSLRDGFDCDNRAVQRVAKSIFSSHWAAQSAVVDHHALNNRVAVVPFGSNLESDLERAEIPNLAQARLQGPLRFLFVGVEWERKGGNLALAIVAELNRIGIISELVVVGCQPPECVYPLPFYVKLEGFVNKRTIEGRRKLRELYRSSAFFIMPSCAEAFGIVFCEANSFAVPCLATDTGGISTIVSQGKNGALFPVDAKAQEYINFVKQHRELSAYTRLAYGSFEAYQDTFNWERAGQSVKLILEELAGGLPRSTAVRTTYSTAGVAVKSQ